MLKLSTKVRYATRAMLDLAVNSGKGAIRIKDIAARQRISAQYLEQLFLRLRRAGLLSSLRGRRGGFKLAKPPSDITLSEIIGAVEDSDGLIQCIDEPKLCRQSNGCTIRNVWTEIAKGMNKVLESTTLQDLILPLTVQLESKEVGQVR